MAQLNSLFATISPFWNAAIIIFLFFLAAWIVHRLGKHLAKRVISLERFTRRRRLRAEQYVVPNGEVWVIRNFSRLAPYGRREIR